MTSHRSVVARGAGSRPCMPINVSKILLLNVLVAAALVPSTPAVAAGDYVSVLVYDGTINGTSGFPPASNPCGDPETGEYQLAPTETSCERYFQGPGEDLEASVRVWAVYRMGFTGKLTVTIDGTSSQTCTVLIGATTAPVLGCSARATGAFTGSVRVTGSAATPSVGEWTIDGRVS